MSDVTQDYCELAADWATSHNEVKELAVKNGSLAMLVAANAVCQRLDAIRDGQRPPARVPSSL